MTLNTLEQLAVQAKKVARTMPADARRCILNWGDRKTPVPDSVWHGQFSHLKHHAEGSGVMFVLSPLGLAVRDILRARSQEQSNDR